MIERSPQPEFTSKRKIIKIGLFSKINKNPILEDPIENKKVERKEVNDLDDWGKNIFLKEISGRYKDFASRVNSEITDSHA